ncbi:MAG: hydroxyacid dehydrogenase [Anaerolineae bacterium]|nr:hydroxyacid dehydrogenase [Anaerolineae bacterium]
MAKYNVLVTIPQPLRDEILTAETLERLQSFANVVLNEDGRNWTAEELADKLPGMDAILASWGLPKLTEEVLAKADRLRIVAYAAGSVKYFVTDALFQRGIVVTHAASRIADSVAEFALLLAMIGLRFPHEFDRRMKAGEPWPRRDVFPFPEREIAKRKVGILGMGYVGRRAARLFQGVGAEVWAYDPYLPEEQAKELGVRKVDLDTLLSQCEVISIHLPTTPETHHMLGAREFSLVQDGAILVQTARSWVWDEEALLKELQQGRFWAAIDVYDQEPLPEDHPFRKLSNVFLTPHVAGRTVDSYQSLTAEVVGDLERFFNGQPLLHQISPEKLAIMA